MNNSNHRGQGRADSGAKQSKGDSARQRKANGMWYVVSAVFLGVLFTVALGIALKGGSPTRVFWWSVAALIFAELGTAALLQFYVIGPRTAHAVLGKRPELYVSGALMKPLKAGEPQTVVLGIKNRKRVTARSIKLGGGNDIFIKSTFEGPLIYRPVPPELHPDIGGPDTEERSLVSRGKLPLTQRLIDDLASGEVLFFHFAEGDYDDGQGTSYPLDYCYMYTPLAPTVMRMCPERYWPTERPQRRGAPTLRPQLVLDAAAANLKKGKPLEVYVVFRNRGYDTVKSMRLEGFTVVVPDTFQGPLSMEEMTPTEVPLTLAAGAPFTVVLRDPNKRWTQNGITEIKKGRALLFHYSRGDWTDENGVIYPIEFCLRYERDALKSGSGMPYMSLAEKKFWPETNQNQQKT